MKHATRPTKVSQFTVIEQKLNGKNEFYSRFRSPDWAKRCVLSLLAIDEDPEYRSCVEAALEAIAQCTVKQAKKPALTLICQEV